MEKLIKLQHKHSRVTLPTHLCLGRTQTAFHALFMRTWSENVIINCVAWRNDAIVRCYVFVLLFLLLACTTITSKCNFQISGIIHNPVFLCFSFSCLPVILGLALAQHFPAICCTKCCCRCRCCCHAQASKYCLVHFQNVLFARNESTESVFNELCEVGVWAKQLRPTSVSHSILMHHYI